MCAEVTVIFYRVNFFEGFLCIGQCLSYLHTENLRLGLLSTYASSYFIQVSRILAFLSACIRVICVSIVSVVALLVVVVEITVSLELLALSSCSLALV